MDPLLLYYTQVTDKALGPLVFYRKLNNQKKKRSNWLSFCPFFTQTPKPDKNKPFLPEASIISDVSNCGDDQDLQAAIHASLEMMQ